MNQRSQKQQLPLCSYAEACTRKACIYRHPPKPPKAPKIKQPSPSLASTSPSIIPSVSSSSSPSLSPKQDDPSRPPCKAYLSSLCTFPSHLCRSGRHPPPEECESLRESFRKRRCGFGFECRTKGCLFGHDDEYDNEIDSNNQELAANLSHLSLQPPQPMTNIEFPTFENWVYMNCPTPDPSYWFPFVANYDENTYIEPLDVRIVYDNLRKEHFGSKLGTGANFYGSNSNFEGEEEEDLDESNDDDLFARVAASVFDNESESDEEDEGGGEEYNYISQPSQPSQSSQPLQTSNPPTGWAAIAASQPPPSSQQTISTSSQLQALKQIDTILIPQFVYQANQYTGTTAFSLPSTIKVGDYDEIFFTLNPHLKLGFVGSILPVIDLHYQSLLSFAVFLNLHLSNLIQQGNQGGGVWIITGTGQHVERGHQKTGGALSTKVQEWLVESGRRYKIGKSGDGVRGGGYCVY